MLQRMSSAELTEWIAFYQLEPFGGDTEYIGHAITAATVANVNRGKHKPAKVEEFMPKFERQKQQTPEQQLQFATMFAAAGFGTIQEGE